MNKLTPFLLGSVLLFGGAACSNVARTSSNAPHSTQANAPAPNLDEVLYDKSDATNPIRRAQANSDIRAREQRYNVFRRGQERVDRNVASEVRSKLEVNLPTSQLTIDANDGVVTVAGMVQTQDQLERIEPLAKEIRGVRDVDVQATLGPNLPPYQNQD